MKATSVSILLSVLAIGAVAMLSLKIDDLGEQIARSRSDRGGRTTPAQEDPRYVVQNGDPTGSSGTAHREVTGKESNASIAEPADLASLRAEISDLKKQVNKNQRSAPTWRRPRRSARSGG